MTSGGIILKAFFLGIFQDLISKVLFKKQFFVVLDQHLALDHGLRIRMFFTFFLPLHLTLLISPQNGAKRREHKKKCEKQDFCQRTQSAKHP